MFGLRHMDTDDEHYYDEAWIGHHISWINTEIVIVILMVLIVVGRYVYKRRIKIMYFFRDAIVHPKYKCRIVEKAVWEWHPVVDEAIALRSMDEERSSSEWCGCSDHINDIYSNKINWKKHEH